MDYDEDDRLREYPADRFDEPLIKFDLDERSNRIQQEPISEEHTQRGHRREQLYRFKNLTHNLFVFEQGGSIPEHNVTDGTVTLQVLSGKLRLDTDDGSHELNAGELLTMKPGILHETHALEETRMLLTIVRHPELTKD